MSAGSGRAVARSADPANVTSTPTTVTAFAVMPKRCSPRARGASPSRVPSATSFGIRP